MAAHHEQAARDQEVRINREEREVRRPSVDGTSAVKVGMHRMPDDALTRGVTGNLLRLRCSHHLGGFSSGELTQPSRVAAASALSALASVAAFSGPAGMNSARSLIRRANVLRRFFKDSVCLKRHRLNMARSF